MIDLLPSHFKSDPFGSVLQNSESETIARNIMKIRTRLGDRWELTWEEYKREREKDGGFSWCEEKYFNDVMPLIADPIGAISFAPGWARAAREASKAS